MEDEFVSSCWLGDMKRVKFLLPNITNIDCQNSFGMTGLMASSLKDNIMIVKFLIHKGANIDFRDNKLDYAQFVSGSTALICASRMGRAKSVGLLIDKGANIDLQDIAGNTAFDQAALHNKKSSSKLPVMVLLKPSIVNQQDANGNTLLMNACQEKHEINVICLYENGADFHQENNTGETAFKILKRKRDLPEKLQSLKEKLILDQLVCDDLSL